MRRLYSSPVDIEPKRVVHQEKLSLGRPKHPQRSGGITPSLQFCEVGSISEFGGVKDGYRPSFQTNHQYSLPSSPLHLSTLTPIH